MHEERAEAAAAAATALSSIASGMQQEPDTKGGLQNCDEDFGGVWAHASQQNAAEAAAEDGPGGSGGRINRPLQQLLIRPGSRCP